MNSRTMTLVGALLGAALLAPVPSAFGLTAQQERMKECNADATGKGLKGADRSAFMPIDLVCYERDSLKLSVRRRFEQGDVYFSALSKEWSEGVRAVFRRLPAVPL